MISKYRWLSAGMGTVFVLGAGVLHAQSTDSATQTTASFPVTNPSSSVSPTPSNPPGSDGGTPLVDPGPRPVGNTSRTIAGAKLQNSFVNSFEPADPVAANNNDGAGNVIANGGSSAGFWFQAAAVFGQEVTVNGVSNGNGATITGLGPAFNGNSCVMCHSQPSVGGSSPAVNPQVAVATLDGATNTVPSFVTKSGPIQEARFILDLANDPSGSTLDGGVHELFSIQGRTDAPSGCVLAQPNFANAISQHNLITRIPIPTFGEGFVENVTEAALQANLAANASTKSSLGIFGRFNRNGNDGTIGRFGWKAQNKSLLLFSGEAANVELGLTNELFQNEKVSGTGCATNGTPEDNTAVLLPTAFPAGTTLTAAEAASEISSDIENFAFFMRFNASPSQCDFASGLNSSGGAVCNSLGTQAQAGAALFGTSANPGIGCVLCHTDTLTTGPSAVPKFNNATFHPFSDFALHHMGSKLADGITQGLAGPDEFRTPPLWGLGQRLFFMHDGRCQDLVCAIEAHRSPPKRCTAVLTDAEAFEVNGTLFTPGRETVACGSEASVVVDKFNSLTTTQAQQLLDFLRSL